MIAFHQGSQKWHRVLSFKPCQMTDYQEQLGPGFRVKTACESEMEVDEIHLDELGIGYNTCQKCKAVQEAAVMD